MERDKKCREKGRRGRNEIGESLHLKMQENQSIYSVINRLEEAKSE